MENKTINISPPTNEERQSLRLMIFIGIFAMGFFLYSMLQKNVISYFPLYVLLMITLFYYSFKFLHEWYHYFSISAHKKPAATRQYTVDILTTYCAGEPFDMLEQTLTAIQNVTYPHVAWCCDEANDPQVKALCERLGVRHMTRTDKKDAKAGNINNALQFATGEICLVLDPDHIPEPSILDEVVPYFEDPSIGFVQIIQAYYNQTDTLVAKGAAQQTYQFYGPVMMTMNTYGTVQAIGANCTFRRAALDSIGGHASGLAEDMHSAMRLHAGGWRSVYVPSILTRGLVPATMSSYYKQQLKWSRGTWELFVTAFPELFTRFTWRQKLHYFTIPFHYLGGLVFLINFLIPVISLFTGYIPLQMDVINFMLAALPLFCMGLFIRHYVQQWVAEETDRGFHIVGGILQIGTWWIHSIGFFYTIFRKKVPYIPTPKNDSDSLPLRLSLPNILIGLVSLIAIVYGFWHNYTPYTVFMAALASMQIIFMAFIISISGYVREDSKINRLAIRIRENNGLVVWSHGVLRKYSVPFSVAAVILFVFSFIQNKKLPEYLPEPLPGLQVFYRGLNIHDDLFTGNATDADLSTVINGNDISIVALDMPWMNREQYKLDTEKLNSLYSKNVLPLLNWNLEFRDGNGILINDASEFAQILNGSYDEQISSLAAQLAYINKPVLLNYNNGAGADGRLLRYKNAGDYKAAWKYVHQIFNKAGANKVIWAWSAPDAATAESLFPGTGYVDWLAVNMDRSDAQFFKSRTYGFDSMYRKYHQYPLFKISGLPVMVTGLSGNNDPTWYNAAWKTIDTGFVEIKAVIAGDKPRVYAKQPISIPYQPGISTVMVNAPLSAKIRFPAEPPLLMQKQLVKQYKLPPGIKSIVYDKGYYWFRNRHTLSTRTIEEDVVAMKNTGINTIERTVPSIYDINLFTVLQSAKMQLVPRFWFLATASTIDDPGKMEKQKNKTLKMIRANIHRKEIIAWSLGDDGLYFLQHQMYKPDYFYYQQKYINWLTDLCTSIRQLDTSRPIIMDLHWDNEGVNRFHFYKTHVPQINTFMLEADVKYTEALKTPLEEGMAWGKVPVELWSQIPPVRESATVPAWQDLENINFVSMDGLLDFDGRKKEIYTTVMNTWGRGRNTSTPIPEIKILRPSAITKTANQLTYRLICKKDNARWVPCTGDEKGIRFEWYLMRVDQFGNTMFIKKAGDGPFITLAIPYEPQYYQLYAKAIAGDEVKIVHASLNTPLE